MMDSWTTTVIVSTSLQVDGVTAVNKELSRKLELQQHRVRYSDSVEPDSFIFPLSGTAFMVITPEEFSLQAESADILTRIEKFVQVHKHSFLLLQSPVYGAREWKIVSTVQDRFLGSNLKILPVHSNRDIVKGMLTIAKVTSKPHVDRVQNQMDLARAQICETARFKQLQTK